MEQECQLVEQEFRVSVGRAGVGVSAWGGVGVGVSAGEAGAVSVTWCGMT